MARLGKRMARTERAWRRTSARYSPSAVSTCVRTAFSSLSGFRSLVLQKKACTRSPVPGFEVHSPQLHFPMEGSVIGSMQLRTSFIAGRSSRVAWMRRAFAMADVLISLTMAASRSLSSLPAVLSASLASARTSSTYLSLTPPPRLQALPRPEPGGGMRLSATGARQQREAAESMCLRVLRTKELRNVYQTIAESRVRLHRTVASPKTPQ